MLGGCVFPYPDTDTYMLIPDLNRYFTCFPLDRKHLIFLYYLWCNTWPVLVLLFVVVTSSLAFAVLCWPKCFFAHITWKHLNVNPFTIFYLTSPFMPTFLYSLTNSSWLQPNKSTYLSTQNCPSIQLPSLSSLFPLSLCPSHASKASVRAMWVKSTYTHIHTAH